MTTISAPRQLSPMKPRRRGILSRGSLWRFGTLLAVLVFVQYACDRLNIDLTRLPGMFGKVGDLIVHRYYPPDMGHVLRPEYLHSVVETLHMSYAATVIGLGLSVPLAWLASFNMSPSR